MLAIELNRADLVNIRFAISPLTELWQSVRALQNPDVRAMHAPWLAQAHRTNAELDLAVLTALQPSTGYSPDFIAPPPDTPSPDFDAELSRVLATPPELVRLEISQVFRGREVPAALRPFLEQPDGALHALGELLRAYWMCLIAPHWERIRAMLEGDVHYRAQQNASGGARAVFADIDASVRYDESTLLLDKPWSGAICPDGRGLLFMPSVFVWPHLAVIEEDPWQPTLIYAARGSGLLWEPSGSAPDALAALIGSRRAWVLAALDVPRSTADLAGELGVSPGSISQHLT
ncbi:MAG: DUF5937 family protein, partial [Pseudonocardiaceae bacterium]